MLAAEHDDPGLLTITDEPELEPRPAPAPVLLAAAIVVPDAVAVLEPTPEPVAQPKKKRSKKIKFGRFEGPTPRRGDPRAHDRPVYRPPVRRRAGDGVPRRRAARRPTLILAEPAGYAIHRLMHRVPWLWRKTYTTFLHANAVVQE